MSRTHTKKRRSLAHREGYAARVAGLPFTAIPYASPSYGKGEAWADGWEEAELKIREGKEQGRKEAPARTSDQ